MPSLFLADELATPAQRWLARYTTGVSVLPADRTDDSGAPPPIARSTNAAAPGQREVSSTMPPMLLSDELAASALGWLARCDDRTANPQPPRPRRRRARDTRDPRVPCAPLAALWGGDASATQRLVQLLERHSFVVLTTDDDDDDDDRGGGGGGCAPPGDARALALR